MKNRHFSLRRGIHVKNHHRFLRPGALARIRDSKLISLSVHKFAPGSVLVSPPPSPPHDQQPVAVDQQMDGSPCFLGKRLRGPICPQRKKLCASKYVFFVPSSPNPVDPGVDLLGSDLVAAH